VVRLFESNREAIMARKSVVSMRGRREIRGSVARGKVDAEYTTASGDTITLSGSDDSRGYMICCWQNGACRWAKFHLVLEDAVQEFKRWM
jgi:hypothetical protein